MYFAHSLLLADALKVGLAAIFLVTAVQRTLMLTLDKAKQTRALRTNLAQRRADHSEPITVPTASLEDRDPIGRPDEHRLARAADPLHSAALNSATGSAAVAAIGLDPEDVARRIRDPHPLRRPPVVGGVCARFWRWVRDNLPATDCSMSGFRAAIRTREVWGSFVCGLFAGLLNGSFGVGGPPQVGSRCRTPLIELIVSARQMLFYSLVDVTKEQIRRFALDCSCNAHQVLFLQHCRGWRDTFATNLHLHKFSVRHLQSVGVAALSAGAACFRNRCVQCLVMRL